jgi:hypothetical protein
LFFGYGAHPTRQVILLPRGILIVLAQPNEAPFFLLGLCGRKYKESLDGESIGSKGRQ